MFFHIYAVLYSSRSHYHRPPQWRPLCNSPVVVVGLALRTRARLSAAFMTFEIRLSSRLTWRVSPSAVRKAAILSLTAKRHTHTLLHTTKGDDSYNYNDLAC